ncbi:MAG: hypothetical protein JNJ57_13945 [Saprospiraceae bacterium]|nr:hypothetical protein [Saprospiraceae bacterium]
MTKPIVLFIATQFFCSLAQAQIEHKGWWTRDLFTYQYFHQPSDNNSGAFERTYHRIFTQPEVGYVIKKNWMVGLVLQYDYRTDNYDIPEGQTGQSHSSRSYYGAGPLIRYYHPIGKRVYFMSEVFGFYARETNGQTFQELASDRKTRYTKTQLGVGSNPSFAYFLTDNLGVSITFANIGYYTDKDSESFTFSINPQQWLLGVEWYFNKKSANKMGDGR